MSLIPGSLPSGSCYGTPQELLDLFAQYLDIPAFAVSSKVLYSGSSPMPNTDFVWIDTSGTTTPVLKLYNEILGTYEEYPFQGQLSPSGLETFISGKTAITTLTTSDLFLVSQIGASPSSAILKKITWGNMVGQIPSNTITYPMLSTSATESTNVAKRVAKAWINFTGTGTVTINEDFNVTSVTDNGGVGDYTINFTSAIGSLTYSVVGSCSTSSASAPAGLTIYPSGLATGTVRVLTWQGTTPAIADSAIITLIVMG